MKSNLRFEEAMTRLEEIVKTLEGGDLPLEKSLKIFEEGVNLSKNCLKMLDEAEKKVEILLGNKEGKKQIRPFALNEASSSVDRAGESGGEGQSSPRSQDQVEDRTSSDT